MFREELMVFEPYLSYLAGEDLDIHRILPYEKTSSIINVIAERVSENYRGINKTRIASDVANNLMTFLYRLEEKRFSKVDRDAVEALFMKEGLDLITNTLLGNQEKDNSDFLIKDINLFLHVSQVVDPIILFEWYKVKKGYQGLQYGDVLNRNLIYLIKNHPVPDSVVSVIKTGNNGESNLYSIDEMASYFISDLHVHFSSSFLFRDILEFIFSAYFTDYPEEGIRILRKDFENFVKANNISIFRKKKIGDHLNDVITLLDNVRKAYIIYGKGKNLEGFIYQMLSEINKSQNNNNRNIRGCIDAIRSLNKLMRLVLMSQDYAGLAVMDYEFFQAPIRRFIVSDRLWKMEQKEGDTWGKKKTYEILLDKGLFTYSFINGSFAKVLRAVELRIAPEEGYFKDTKKFIEKIKEVNGSDVKVMIGLHYKKIKSVRVYNVEQEFFKPVGSINEIIKGKGRRHKKLSILSEWIYNTYEMFRYFEEYTLRKGDNANRKDFIDLVSSIDAASLEAWTPPWMFRVIYQFWREYASYVGKNNLSFIYHAGEDFLSAAHGLRYVYEAMYFLNVQRIGHCTAPFFIKENHKKAYLFRKKISPTGFFFTLLWLNHIVSTYTNYFTDLQINWESLLSRSISLLKLDEIIADQMNLRWPGSLSSYLSMLYNGLGFSNYFIHDVDIQTDLEKTISIIHKFLVLLKRAALNSFKDIWEAFSSESEFIIYMNKTFLNIRNIVDHLNSVYPTSIEVLPILPTSIMPRNKQIDLLMRINEIVLGEIENRGIIVECCPSSNVYILNINSHEDHPIIKFVKRNPDSEIKISICTDNPGIINATSVLEHLVFLRNLYEE